MKSLRLLLAALLVLSFLVSACSQAAPAPAKPAEKAAEVKPAEKPAEAKPAAAQPAQPAAKPAEAKPADKPAEARPAAKADDRPAMKIGYLTSLTSVFAGLGKDQRDGFVLYLEQKGGQLGGRKIEVISEDDEGKPDVGLTKSRKLVERDNVKMIAGIISSGVAYAVAEYANSQKVPFFIQNAGADDLTQRQASKYIFRNSFANSQNTHGLGEWAYQKGYRKAAIVSADYAAGWEYSGGFARTFTQAGGQIIQELYYPLGGPDPSPFVTGIKPEADVVYSFSTGTDAVRVVKAYTDYGIKKRAPLLGPGGLTDNSILPEQGDSALDVITTGNYTDALDNSANKAFLDAFQKKYGRIPNYTGEHGYVAAMMLEKALAATQGNFENQDAFLSAFEKVEIPNAPRGPVKFDSKHNVVNNIYVMQVKKVNNRLVNSIVETWKDVTQFGKWSPEEFLKMPTYADMKGKWAK